MSAQISPFPVFQWTSAQGPAVGYKLYTYGAGTSTPQATYTDYTLSTPNTNPVVLNSAGFAPVWLNSVLAYKFVLKDAKGNTIWTVDNINAPALTAEVLGMILYPETSAETSADLTPTSFQYFPGYGDRYTFPSVGATGQVFENGGAIIQRFNDRVMVGDAAVNDCDYPNVTKDWLSAFQTSYNTASGINGGGPPNGTILGIQMAVLGNHATGLGAFLAGSQSLNNTSGQTDLIASAFFAVNNSPSVEVDAWTHYSEIHRLNDTVGSATGFELDVVNRGLLRQINPYNQNAKVSTAYLAAAGAGYQATVTLAAGTPGVVNWTNHGLSAGAGVMFSDTYYGLGAASLPAAVTSNAIYYVVAPVTANSFSISATSGGAAIAFASNSSGTIAGANGFPPSVAFYVGANPVPFDKGLVFTNDSISGATGSSGYGYAINLASGHIVQWWGFSGGEGVPTGAVVGTGTNTAQAATIVLQDANFLFQVGGLDACQINGNANAVNYLEIFNSATGVPVTLAAGGNDANIDLELLPLGVANVRLGNAASCITNGTHTPSGLGAICPSANATPVGWFAIKDNNGAVRYVPYY